MMWLVAPESTLHVWLWMTLRWDDFEKLLVQAMEEVGVWDLRSTQSLSSCSFVNGNAFKEDCGCWSEVAWIPRPSIDELNFFLCIITLCLASSLPGLGLFIPFIFFIRVTKKIASYNSKFFFRWWTVSMLEQCRWIEQCSPEHCRQGEHFSKSGALIPCRKYETVMTVRIKKIQKNKAPKIVMTTNRVYAEARPAKLGALVPCRK